MGKNQHLQSNRPPWVALRASDHAGHPSAGPLLCVSRRCCFFSAAVCVHWQGWVDLQIK